MADCWTAVHLLLEDLGLSGTERHAVCRPYQCHSPCFGGLLGTLQLVSGHAGGSTSINALGTRLGCGTFTVCKHIECIHDPWNVSVGGNISPLITWHTHPLHSEGPDR